MSEQNHASTLQTGQSFAKPAENDRHHGEVDPATPQLQGRLLHISTQLAQMQAQLARLVDVAQNSSSQVDALTRHLTDLDATRTLEERLAELLSRAETYQEQLDEIANTTKKLSRTQFKSNTLGETKEQQIAAALETLQEIVTRREEVAETHQVAERERLAEVRAQARGEFAAELLPVLDGLEMALESGRSLLERRKQQQMALQEQERIQLQSADHGALQRVLQNLRNSLTKEPEVSRLPSPPVPARNSNGIEERLAAWLDGLDLVQDRFVNVLAAEEIEIIPALHQPFDPKLHVAVSVDPRSDVPPGTVVEVLRRGYRQRGRILRFAEVVVARSPDG